MKTWIVAGALALIGTGAWAEVITKDASGSVTEAMDRLEAAATAAGATIFARVDHGAGAMKVEMELADAQLLIFGNPMLGTPVMQQDIRAGLALPLHVLIYDNDGQTVITYDDIDGMFAGLDLNRDAEVFTRIEGALNNLTNAAAGQ